MNIKSLPPSERPVEKTIEQGVESLSNSEILAVILGSGSRAKSAIGLAEEILARDENGIWSLSYVTLDELLEISGVGPFKAVKILAALELGKRVATAPREKNYIGSSQDVANLFMEKLRYEKREYFKVLLLNTKGKIISIETVSIGELSGAPVHPREVFLQAVKKSAAGVIFVHNHPSGDPTPSSQDILVTKELVECGKLLKIGVIDHIIIGDGVFISLREKGEI